jgi:putative membrane protein
MTRAPQVFVLDRDDEKPKSRKAPKIEMAEEAIPADLIVLPHTTSSPTKRFRWGTILITALFALIVMWAGLTITQLVESFFARNAWLGWSALVLAALAGFAAVAIVTREVWGLYRLNQIEALQEKIARALNLSDNTLAKAAVGELETLYASRPDQSWALKTYRSHDQDIIDATDRLRLMDRIVLHPMDEEANRIIAKRARRVTLITTVTPLAALDILFVAAINLGMLRELAALYGGRPSTVATLKLARMVMTHLAVSGGLALSDNLIQHVVGKGLLGRLSARFGEGAVNGILTSRIGLAAIDVCRPIPSSKPNRETLGKLLTEIVRFGGKDETDAPSKP